MHRPFMVENQLHFLIVGSVCKHPKKDPSLTITGPVDRIEPFFAAADYAVNPIFAGSGTSVKVAEFIAARIPILTTSVGARGFAVRPGINMLVFDETSLLSCINEAISSGQDFDAMTRSAYDDNQAMIQIDASIVPLQAKIKLSTHSVNAR